MSEAFGATGAAAAAGIAAATALIAGGGAAAAAGAVAGAVGGLLGGGASAPPPAASLGLKVSIGGSPISDTLAAQIVTVEVETNLSLPDAMLVGFFDPGRTVVSDASLDLGVTLEVAAAFGTSDPVTLASGEVTALEVDYDELGTVTIVRGLDMSNRLMRGTQTKAYQQMAASDVVSQLASDGNLDVGQIDSTSTTYPVLTQANQTDWDFIQQLARESNRVAYCQDGSLYFVKPLDTSAAPDAADGTTAPTSGQLVLGLNLSKVHLAVTGADAVSTVTVGGWDPDNKAAITGTGTAGTVSATNDDDPSTIAGTFGGETYVYTDIPFDQQSEADDMAAALAERFGSSYVEIDGTAAGDPSLQAGTPVTISKCGDPFDGSYVLSSARHVMGRTGTYTTEFTVSGMLRDTTLGGLTTSARQGSKRHKIPGVAIGIVNSTQDPNNTGMVQLQFPWLDAAYVSDWVRVVQPTVGDGSWGSILIPEVNSEVLVAFEQGDVRKPYVIGGLYNGTDTITPQSDVPLIDEGTGAVNQRLFQSRTMHMLYFNDSQTAPVVTLQTGDGKNMLQMQPTPTETPALITLQSGGSIMIQADQSGTLTLQQGQNQIVMSTSSGIQVTSGTNLAIKAQANMTVSAAMASVTSQGTLSLSGSMTSINS
jgi:phage protein D